MKIDDFDVAILRALAEIERCTSYSKLYETVLKYAAMKRSTFYTRVKRLKAFYYVETRGVICPHREKVNAALSCINNFK